MQPIVLTQEEFIHILQMLKAANLWTPVGLSSDIHKTVAHMENIMEKQTGEKAQGHV